MKKIVKVVLSNHPIKMQTMILNNNKYLLSPIEVQQLAEKLNIISIDNGTCAIRYPMISDKN
jgi:hypothetical protein